MKDEQFWKDIIYKDGKLDEREKNREKSIKNYSREKLEKMLEELK